MDFPGQENCVGGREMNWERLGFTKRDIEILKLEEKE